MRVTDEPGVDVSVVIPTTGRPTVDAAIASALSQAGVAVEVLVCVDGDETVLPTSRVVADSRVRVLYTRGELTRRGNTARRLGAAAARGRFIALLDDDDIWLPEKAKRQIEVAEETLRGGAKDVIVVCRAYLRKQVGHERIRVVPRQTIRGNEPVAGYLFRRRRIKPHHAFLCASMLLFNRELVNRAEFVDTIHDDWDWVLRSQHAGAVVAVADEPLLEVTLSAPGRSASMSARWAESITWFESGKHSLSPREVGEGLLCCSGGIAGRARDWRGVVAVARRVCGRYPAGWRAWAFFLLTALVPRGVLRRAGSLDVLARRSYSEEPRIG